MLRWPLFHWQTIDTIDIFQVLIKEVEFWPVRGVWSAFSGRVLQADGNRY